MEDKKRVLELQGKLLIRTYQNNQTGRKRIFKRNMSVTKIAKCAVEKEPTFAK